jgi:HD-GYP domain-containing protein (c-di-GMP phosphodiesterase class II)
MQQKEYRPTFYLTINSLFILLIVGVGVILTWHNYQLTKKIVLKAANVVYEKVLREVTQDFTHTYRPVFQSVRLLSLDPLLEAKTLDERLGALEHLSTILEYQPAVSAIQVGYGNGDFFIIRSISSEKTRKLFHALENSTYVVDNITTDPISNQRMLYRSFYDESLQEIGQQQPETTEYDPRTRPWYKNALVTSDVTASEPYLFYFLKQIGTTVGYSPPGSESVIAADVALHQISDTLVKHLLTPGSEIALIGVGGRVIAYNDPEKLIVGLDADNFELAHLSQLESGVFNFIDKNNLLKPGPIQFHYNNDEWLGDVRTLNVSGKEGRDLTLAMISPSKELLANVISMVKRSLFITAVIILLSIPVASYMAALISRALHNLSKEALLIGRFDFTKPISLRSKIKEVDELAISMGLMKNTISRFLTLINSLAGEQNFDAMIELITQETLNVSEVDGVLTWIVNDQTHALDPAALFGQSSGRIGVEGLPSFQINSDNALIRAAHNKEGGQVHLNSKQDSELATLLEKFRTDDLLVTVIPLHNRQQEIIGLLCLLNRKTKDRKGNEPTGSRMDFVRTFSGFAAVSLESRKLLEMQKRLMDSFMHLIAGAIDAKSPYTGGHCQRVPVITKMIARAACEDDTLFKDYQLDDEGWEAIHLAGWLHDCGKVTTPEYVVDKSTKLETIYDRIHEIRTRFEVLKRDAEIRYWEQVANGGDKTLLKADLKKEWSELDDDFAFIAESNLGGEFMAPERIERLEQIAQRKWLRTLDDRIGISWEEENRREKAPKKDLPVEEFVLADRQDHLIERNENERMPEDNSWGFKLNVPEYRYNLGELYNLKIARGTLTAEERYKINDHIVQTIIMLEKLPYPKHLREVPELAGGHHETMDGNGYPKRLIAEQMSVTARMMAIADIFEALTASDRPYKKAKKLSEAIRIMNFMKKDNHIDPDLFSLFLRSGVYKEYAEQYLDSSQIDDFDIEEYILPS